MSASRHDRVTKLFGQACDLDPAERPAFLKQACGDDEELRAEVESLLERDARAAARFPDATIEQPRTEIGSGEPALKRLGDFEILGELGRGGMGVVYDARQISLKRRVALKVLPPTLGLGEQARQRFEREAQAAARLHHNNIVPVHAIGGQDGSHFYAMERIDGQSLDRVLGDLTGGRDNSLMEQTVASRTATAPPHEDPKGGTGEPVSLSEGTTSGREWFDTVARLTAEVADALHYAHGRGVIHRDIKPANLILSTEGRLWVTDFGLARLAEEPGLTVTGSFFGTPAYMSPEQAASGRMGLDHRTDIYSLGAVLYEMLTLRRPFQAPTREQLVTAVLTRDPKRPRKLNGRIPVDLETICLKAMEKDPSRRYASADAMAEDLRSFLQRGLITARRAGPLRRMGKWVRRHPLLSTASVAALVVLGLTVSVLRLSAGRSLAQALQTVTEARLSLTQGDYRRGLEHVDEALELAPQLPEARLVRARLLLSLERTDGAIEEARQILARDPEDWTGHLVLAEAALRHGAADLSADEHLDHVRRLAPETAESFYLQGLFTETAEEAVELLNRALALDPGHARALAERSYRQRELKDFPAALLDAERLAALRPHSPRGRIAIAGVRLEQHDTQSALEEFGRALELDPEDPWTYFGRAKVYQQLQQLDKAMSDIDRAIELDPRSAMPYTLRGWIHVSLGQYDDAVSDGNRSLELDPDMHYAYPLIIEAHKAAGRREPMVETLERLRAASSGWKNKESLVDALWAMARESLGRGETESALATMEELIELWPDRPWAYLRRAMIHKMRNDDEAFERDCDRALGMTGLDLDDLLGVASWGPDCGKLDESIAAQSEIIAMRPKWADAYASRSYLYDQSGRIEEALADLDRAIELAPRASHFYRSRAALFQALYRFDAALRDLDRSFELGDDDEEGRVTRATVRQIVGDIDGAFADVDHLIATMPNKGRGYRMRGSLFEKLGEMEKAIEAMEKAVEVEPGNPWGYQYLAEYGMLAGRSCDEVMRHLSKSRELQFSPLLAFGEVWVHAGMVGRYCPEHLDAPELLKAAQVNNSMQPSGWGWINLGFAAYRAGDYEQSRDAFLASRGFPGSNYGDVAGMFGLAMSHGQLGEIELAGKALEQGVESMNSTYPDWPRYLGLRKEAEEVLGIP